ncbi:TetR/AcrR family transcriptional regulator [Yinghuangia sp. ASG 101]|uniref:TetR/AcrR family transcriptional regulator n=1 Tax=Yinghuangia sp. ASG 101 TaxID=2896848 RepID=UPI001E510306|nr:TetR/AcrR family transcriptional regulator [Yinghuangia sp. ASG 101]UGQ11397.1 TetR/AcrR family transcriptional regulator [Yinghuangia sp. ASG 101]
MTAPPPRPALRADAQRNYERLVRAAGEVFAERGVDVPMDDIARHAGVGNATLYRRFPTRTALLQAVHHDRIDALCSQARTLLATPSPAEGLATWLRELARQGSTSRGLATAVMIALRDEGSDVAWCREAMFAAASALIDRAQSAGAVRTDVTAAQVLKLVNAIAFVTECEPDGEQQADRLLAVVMDGLRPHEERDAAPDGASR